MPINISNARISSCNSLPASKPSGFYQKRDVMILYTDGQPNRYFYWDRGWVEDATILVSPVTGGGTGTNGQDGKDAVVTVKSVQTTTLAAGTPATVVINDTNVDPRISDLAFQFGIPQGQQGASSGSGGGTTVTGGTIVVVPTGTDDTSNLRQAFAANKETGKPIELYGNYRVYDKVEAELDHFNLVIKGNNAKWRIMTNDPITAIKRRTPVDNSEALNIGTFAKWRITDLVIEGNSNQIGIDCGPAYNTIIDGCYFDGLKRGIHGKFALWSKFRDNMYINCYDGIILDVGDWPNATNYNSQSNSCEVTGRYYGNSAVMAAIREAFPDYRELLQKQFSAKEGERVVDVYSQIQNIISQHRVTAGGVAFGFYGVSGGWLHDFIVEGVSAGAAIDFDGLGSTVVKDFTVERGHIESVQGFSTAAINIRILSGTITIDKIFGQYPAIFMQAESTTGLANIEVSNVPYWVPKNGKYFKTTNISQHYYKNEAFRGINSTFWEGTPPPSCMPVGSIGCGYHRYTWTDVGR